MKSAFLFLSLMLAFITAKAQLPDPLKNYSDSSPSNTFSFSETNLNFSFIDLDNWSPAQSKKLAQECLANCRILLNKIELNQIEKQKLINEYTQLVNKVQELKKNKKKVTETRWSSHCSICHSDLAGQNIYDHLRKCSDPEALSSIRGTGKSWYYSKYDEVVVGEKDVDNSALSKLAEAEAGRFKVQMDKRMSFIDEQDKESREQINFNIAFWNMASQSEEDQYHLQKHRITERYTSVKDKVKNIKGAIIEQEMKRENKNSSELTPNSFFLKTWTDFEKTFDREYESRIAELNSWILSCKEERIEGYNNIVTIAASLNKKFNTTYVPDLNISLAGLSVSISENEFTVKANLNKIVSQGYSFRKLPDGGVATAFLDVYNSIRISGSLKTTYSMEGIRQTASGDINIVPKRSDKPSFKLITTSERPLPALPKVNN